MTIDIKYDGERFRNESVTKTESARRVINGVVCLRNLITQNILKLANLCQNYETCVNRLLSTNSYFELLTKPNSA